MTSPAPPPQYLTRDGDAFADRDLVLSLWHGNLGQVDRIAAKYDWFYLGCPHGMPLLKLLHHAPQSLDIGTACAGRRRMLWRGEEIRAGVLVDLAVQPEHRSLGPALILQQDLLKAGGETLDLLYGFPNPKAAAVFKRIGYEKFGELVRHARVLRHARYLRARMPAPLAEIAGLAADVLFAFRDGVRRLRAGRLDHHWSARADNRMDALWHSTRKSEGLIGIRDSAHCKWRFDDSPLASTRYLLLNQPGAVDLEAWFATQVDAGTLHVRDFWSKAGDGRIDTRHLLALLAAAREAGHAAVSVEIATDPERLQNWKQCGFVERTRRPIFGRWSLDHGAPMRTSDLFLTSADEDE